MELNLIETLVAKWLNHQKYVTMLRVPFWLDKQLTQKKQSQWSDVDILAIKEDVVLFVECKSFLGGKKIANVVEDIEKRLRLGSKFLTSDTERGFPWLVKKEKKFMVVAAYPDNLGSYIKAVKLPNLEIKHFAEIVNEVITRYSELIKEKQTIGKEEENMLRLLSHLIELGYIDHNQLPDVINGKVTRIKH